MKPSKHQRHAQPSLRRLIGQLIELLTTREADGCSILAERLISCKFSHVHLREDLDTSNSSSAFAVIS
jgi:hypothetical protein